MRLHQLRAVFLLEGGQGTDAREGCGIGGDVHDGLQLEIRKISLYQYETALSEGWKKGELLHSTILRSSVMVKGTASNASCHS
uniref:Uncharacterized protein n=1 Tax=Pristionchus pacificus TaxID=54126 RepID=A0A2A6CV93_PRIPA|eukprot:PDM82142.1 hypothetical protein PRIPAC_36535 [Pristionchus pacificus]